MTEKHHVQSNRRKHVPIRTCVVCRSKGDKRGLTRLVRTADGVMIDLSGKINGRGAYLCEKESCWDRAVNTNILEKALKTNLTNADRERLKQVNLSHDYSD